MSVYISNYRIQFHGVEENAMEIIIADTESGQGIASFVDLEASGDPFHLFTLNNEETKFSAIRALQCEIKFYSTDAVNLTTFLGSNDNRWMVTATCNGNTVFQGYLLLDDIEEDFLDSSIGNEVTLIATDNLGLLKDIPLTDFAGKNPRGYFTLARYIAWCLSKTGLILPINIAHNVREEHEPTKILYDSCYLWSKTFETEINESEDCYTVLEKILGQDSFITQSDGEWWIKRIDEYGYTNTTVHKFNDAGVYQSSATYPAITQTIGPNEAMFFSGMATFIKPQAPSVSVKETYNFDYPKEIIDNVDFDRDKDNETYSNTYVENGETKTEKRYSIADWTLSKPLGGTPVTPTSQAYIRRIFMDGYEKDRYVVITPSSGGGLNHIYINTRIPIEYKDKFTVSFDTRMGVDQGGSGNYTSTVGMVRLYAYDGTFWTVGNDGVWAQSNSSFLSNTRVITWNGNLQDNQGEWASISATAKPAPVSGDIEIILTQNGLWGGGAETHFQNLQFVYTPYINGSYQKYRGQYNKVSQNKSIKKKLEEDVKISDSPRKLFKGALHRYNGTRYVLAGRVYDGLQFGSTVPDAQYLHTFGHNQVFAVWNQNNRPFRTFDFNIQGLNTAGTLPTLLHEYQINEVTDHTTGKRFMLLHYDMDFNLCEWKGVMAEVSDSAINKDYASPFEFKYITER